MRSPTSQRAETPLAGQAPPVAQAAAAWLAALAAATFVAHMLVAGNYGYFRDELYYIADGFHLQAGYVDQPLLMGWLAALLRVVAGDSLVAIHVVPALACALLVVLTGLLAREVGGGRVAQVVAGVAALCMLDFLGVGSLFSMDVLDALWWALASLILARLLRCETPRLWLPFGLVLAIGLLTKLTILFLGGAVVLALLVTPARRFLRTPWPWAAAGIALLGLLPYALWNAANGWPTVEFYRHYGGVGASLADFVGGQVGLMNPVALPLAAAGLVAYARTLDARFRPLGWTFVFAALPLALLRTKAYFLAPAYPLLFAAGAVAFERLRPRPGLAWARPAYVAALVLAAFLLAPAVMPILPPATYLRSYKTFEQVLADRFGWQDLAYTVEQVVAALPPDQRARACVLASNYGEAGALSFLAAPGRLPPVISGHNNYYLWGPGHCTGAVLIGVGYPPGAFRRAYTHVTLAATQRCPSCVVYEQNLPIVVASGPRGVTIARQWRSIEHFD